MNFITTTNRAGLNCETEKAGYWIWIDNNGNVIRQINCTPVQVFPSAARKATQMEKYFNQFQPRFALLLSLPVNSDQYKSLWWEIKTAVKDLN